jgi:hypothetical protein
MTKSGPGSYQGAYFQNNIDFARIFCKKVNQLLPLFDIFSGDASLKAITKDNLHRLNQLEYLFSSANQISFIAEDTFDDCPRIGSIFLSENHLTLLTPKIFSKLTNLKTLYLDENVLTTFGYLGSSKCAFSRVRVDKKDMENRSVYSRLQSGPGSHNVCSSISDFFSHQPFNKQLSDKTFFLTLFMFFDLPKQLQYF